jgi:hypothetical protein
VLSGYTSVASVHKTWTHYFCLWNLPLGVRSAHVDILPISKNSGNFTLHKFITETPSFHCLLRSSPLATQILKKETVESRSYGNTLLMVKFPAFLGRHMVLDTLTDVGGHLRPFSRKLLTQFRFPLLTSNSAWLLTRLEGPCFETRYSDWR